jgi:hypothetical protein
MDGIGGLVPGMAGVQIRWIWRWVKSDITGHA